MKSIGSKFSALVFAAALLLPATMLAQKEDKDKDKDKEVKEKKVEQIIITRKGDKKDEKVVVEINGDKVTINGKPAEDYKDDDFSVRTQRYNDYSGMSWSTSPRSGYSFNYNGDKLNLFNADSNHAMLGVSTETVDEGVSIDDVTKESAAEKAGLKEKDIITKIDDVKISNPDDLSAAVKKHKPGDKITVTYLRDKKEQKTTAELTKWKGFSYFPSQNFKVDLGDMNLGVMPRTRNGSGLFSTRSNPKMGLSVQDSDDGKGVKVIEVDDESNAAKAGIKEDDVITEVDGKTINGADDIAKVIRESKDRISVMMKVQRAGKTQNIEVKIPRKLKTADL